MRNRILVSLDSQKEKNIYDVINEKGNYLSENFSKEELNNLVTINFFDFLNKKYGLNIDLYEEQVICDNQVIKNLLTETEIFLANCTEMTTRNILVRIEKLLMVASEKHKCIYFIL